MTSWLIGSAAECDLIVDLQAVSGRHCRLTQKADGFYLEDLQSTNGTYVNGQRLSSTRRVSNADKITLGQNIEFPWPAEASTAVANPPTASDERIVTIGQAADNDLILDRPTVSGHHARLVIRGSEIQLEDLGSTNGTFVGTKSQRIQKVRVQLDDKIYLGSYMTKVRSVLTAAKIPVSAASPSKRTTQRPKGQALKDRREVAATLGAKSTRRSNTLLFAVAGTALLVVCLMGSLMIWLSGKPDTATAAQETAGQPVEKAKRSPTPAAIDDASRSGFRMGAYTPSHVVERIRVTIRVGPGEQDLKQPVDLDLGGGFLLRLSSVQTPQPTSSAVAFPQKSSLKAAETTIAAGKDAWFEFSAKDEENSEGQFSATPQVLADFSFDQITAIRFLASDKSTDWMLAGYEIQINGQLYAAHDSVNWRVKEQEGKDQSELAELLNQQTKLDEEVAAAEAYIQKGLGEVADERDLRDKKKQSGKLAKAIKTLRASFGGSQRAYVERNSAFRPGRSPTTLQPET